MIRGVFAVAALTIPTGLGRASRVRNQRRTNRRMGLPQMRNILFAFALLLSSCAARRANLALPQPGGSDGPAPAWLDLRPGMELRIEGAYYREGSPRRNATDYLGAETATYEVLSNGTLRLRSVSSFLNGQPGKEQPRNQLAVQLLIRRPNLTWRYHRLFFPVVMSRTGTIRPAALLGSRSVSGAR